MGVSVLSQPVEESLPSSAVEVAFAVAFHVWLLLC